MSDVFHHAVDAVGVLQDIHTLGVGVVAYCEWTPNGLSKFPADTATFFLLVTQINVSHHFNSVEIQKQSTTILCGNI